MPHISGDTRFVVDSYAEYHISSKSKEFYSMKSLQLWYSGSGLSVQKKAAHLKPVCTLKNIFNEKAPKYLGHDADFYLWAYLFLLTYVSWVWWSSLICTFWMLHSLELFLHFLLYDTITLFGGVGWSRVQCPQGYYTKCACKLHCIALNDLRCCALRVHLFCSKHVCVRARATAALTEMDRIHCLSGTQLLLIPGIEKMLYRMPQLRVHKGQGLTMNWCSSLLQGVAHSLAEHIETAARPQQNHWNTAERQKSSLSHIFLLYEANTVKPQCCDVT